MRRIFIYISLTLPTLCFINCSTPQFTQASQEDNIHKVDLETLIVNVKKYHGLTVQTKGLFESSFEVSSIFSATPEYRDGKFVYKIKSWPGIWIELDLRHTPPDSIDKFCYHKSSLLATVQGTIDTTRTGHMGQYVATITNARFLVDN